MFRLVLSALLLAGAGVAQDSSERELGLIALLGTQLDLESSQLQVVEPYSIAVVAPEDSQAFTYRSKLIGLEVGDEYEGVKIEILTGDGGKTFLEVKNGGLWLGSARGAQRAIAGPSRSNRSRNGCDYHSGPGGSNMTCYQNGRVTMRSTCTVTADFRVTCRSSY